MRAEIYYKHTREVISVGGLEHAVTSVLFELSTRIDNKDDSIPDPVLATMAACWTPNHAVLR